MDGSRRLARETLMRVTNDHPIFNEIGADLVRYRNNTNGGNVTSFSSEPEWMMLLSMSTDVSFKNNQKNAGCRWTLNA